MSKYAQASYPILIHPEGYVDIIATVDRWESKREDHVWNLNDGDAASAEEFRQQMERYVQSQMTQQEHDEQEEHEEQEEISDQQSTKNVALDFALDFCQEHRQRTQSGDKVDWATRTNQSDGFTLLGTVQDNQELDAYLDATYKSTEEFLPSLDILDIVQSELQRIRLVVRDGASDIVSGVL